jgi:hypothetical protein
MSGRAATAASSAYAAIPKIACVGPAAMPRRVSCVPSSDDAFVAATAAALERANALTDADWVARLIEATLRPAYPFVEVHRQHILARIPGDDVWYAYRDGAPGREAERP